MTDHSSWVQRHWLLLFSLVWGSFVVLPFLAPTLMQIGWESAAGAIYSAYSFTCHQMPQRSFFLFGSQTTYSLGQIQAAFQESNNPLILRQFTGNPAMGWKVAWSDRMVSMYTAILPATWLWALFRKRLAPLSLRGFALLLLPMAIDGGSHVISDLAGIGNGFRDTNLWLAPITGHALPASFYAGDALGSFNSWMRLLTGILFAVGLVWVTLPHMRKAMRSGEQRDGRIQSSKAPFI